MEKKTIPAVVVGLCAHGLAICRSLGRRGVPVYALESHEQLPGMYTRYAIKQKAVNINGPELVNDLIKIGNKLRTRSILFLTNDNMVKTVAESYRKVAELFDIDFGDADFIINLLDKRSLASIAEQAGLNYPRTWQIASAQELYRVSYKLSYPVALKPSAPLSKFKAIKVSNESDLRRAVLLYEDKVKSFLVQEWISGSEKNIYFCSTYFSEDGRALTSFVGRKIRSMPRYTGVTSSAEPSDRRDILEVTMKFFKGLKIRGPVSLELKEDERGIMYVIEPTVGRFDYWLLCCIGNGVNLPLISYMYRTERKIFEIQRPKKSVTWVDFERDLPVFLDSLRSKHNWREGVSFLQKKKVFALWDKDDFWPSIFSWLKGACKYAGKMGWLLRKLAI
jgi:predicted ATP-grasp superfamily ATP-dependent carboligase